ncbi:Na+/H+ antiporter subunit E [Bdellovibrio bacteriovorus]|uniref:Na+/H+ antiporter subunit E n=1 Tax=Bdellovibrio bacteriovorus TaxID=959 RepID=A0A1Z3N7L1_BDEBC|nr:Na+/H+ antiporter subunit E [Bdellovibrio bacteriovorus]ASD63473.1 hypothetical protein B9G79_07770 [Bdellovibrio bacteriovorus]
MMRVVWVVEVLLKFAWDFCVAVLQVVSWVFRPNRFMKPVIVRLPLDIKSKWGIWWLSLIIFLIPGSMVIRVRQDLGLLYVHLLHTDDADKDMEVLKSRFEYKLRLILGEVKS